MKRMKKREKDAEMMKSRQNGGFTLIELLVVTAIMALLVGGATIGFSLLSRGDAKKAVKTISSKMAEARTDGLSISGEWFLKIYRNNQSYRLDVVRTFDSKNEVISSSSLGSKIALSYQDSKTGTRQLEDGNELEFSFQAGSGRIKQIQLFQDGTDKENTQKEGENLAGDGSDMGTLILKAGSSSTEYTITVFYQTGKVVIDGE